MTSSRSKRYSHNRRKSTEAVECIHQVLLVEVLSLERYEEMQLAVKKKYSLKVTWNLSQL